MNAKLGLVGARGFTGRELLKRVAGHPRMTLAYAASRAEAGNRVQAVAPEFPGELTLVAPDPEEAAKAGLDVCVLALPNGEAKPYVEAFDAIAPKTVLVDLSADHRFTDAWVYGLPELGRDKLTSATRISNPGCYATAVILALAPLAKHLSGPASAFGVSGYSGAGSTPSPRNDAERLKDSVMPYALAGHGHEAEIRRHAGAAVNFSPHVAGFFRGIVATVQAPLNIAMETGELRALYETAFADEPLIRIQDAAPEVRDGRDIPGAVIGGFTCAPAEKRAVVAVALDNLLKGAAAQALQNANIALGLPELAGLAVEAA